MRVHVERDLRFLLLAIEFGHRLDLGVGITFLAETERHEIGCLRQQVQVKHDPGLREHEVTQVSLVDDHVTNKLDVRNRVHIAFVDVDVT